MKPLIILPFLLLIGCSTSKEKVKNSNGEKSEGWTKPTQVKNNEQSDYFKVEAKDAHQKDVLYTETMSRFEDTKLDVPVDVADPLSQAMNYCYQKDFERGLAIFKSVQAKYVKNESYYNQLGSCYLLKNNLLLATLYYKKSTAINKKYAPPYNNLGVVSLKYHKAHVAIKYFKEALREKPFAIVPRFNLAQVYLQYGMMNEALEIFNALYSNGTKDPDVISGIANAYLIKGNVTDSVSFFKQIDSRFHARPEVGLNYAVALNFTGNSQEAQTVFNRVDRTKLDKWDYYYHRVGKLLESAQ